jgi:hypothetical protein
MTAATRVSDVFSVSGETLRTEPGFRGYASVPWLSPNSLSK